VALVLACPACRADLPPDPFGGEGAPTPRLFAPGVVSTELREYGLALTPDMSEAYFTRRDRRGPPEILVTHFVGGAWSEPQPASFSYGRAEAPSISRDGDRMVFASDRALPLSGDVSDNIWESWRTGEGWSVPVPIAGDVNQPRWEDGEYDRGDESGPVLLPSGELLYWAGTHPDWGNDIYVAQPDAHGAFVEPRPLRLNSNGDDSYPAVSPDGRHLVFQSYGRAGAIGEQDLYVSERTAFGWTDPRPLPEPINSERSDGYASFSPDGRFFFFASDRGKDGGYYSIYQVDIAALGLDESSVRSP
jgi:Tol biopolymer transport system component